MMLAQFSRRNFLVASPSTTISALMHQGRSLILRGVASISTGKDSFRVGILRETYDKWERRVPLCPDHVRSFLERHPHCEVYIQPSTNRIYPSREYEERGATVQEDLSNVDLIIGVKRPKSMQGLPSNKIYMFFSHVIKGQPENMCLLRDCLDKRVQLIDYECILDPPNEKGLAKRSIAFGKFAGYAGMVDCFPALGRRLLLRSNFSTPFLACPPTIHHYDLNGVKRSISQMADRLASDGLPEDMEPLVFCMTGKGGNAYSGAREIFDMLPHEIVSVNELRDVLRLQGPQHKIYGVVPEKSEIYEHADGITVFERSHYMKNPHLYKSAFAEKVAPYVHAVVHCSFWDHRFPRLLTKDDIQDIYMSGNERLMLVSDISCDPGGAIEFFERSTTLDKPCYQYDPIQGREVSDHIEDIGVTMLGVDILPTELPADSSQHFGDKLCGILDEMVEVKHMTPANHNLDIAKLSPRLQNATITTAGGALTKPFFYLGSIMELQQLRASPLEPSKEMLLHLDGHLFDSGLINTLLDLIEDHGCGFEFKECSVRRNPSDGSKAKSYAVLKVSGSVGADFVTVSKKLHDLVDAIQIADATLKIYDENNKPAYVQDPEDRNVLVIGSGLVSKSVVEFIGRSKDRRVTVASNTDEEARCVARSARHGRHTNLDVVNDKKGLAHLIKRADVVISLLPAPMHPPIAEQCIKYRTDLVTASYESNEMRKHRQAAEEAGIVILNEVGLDPGLDHMSAMRLIDDICDRGGIITGFSSVCGGLPSPEAANNPLKYKFSWSPRGVISASQNPARYRENGHVIEVEGKDLLLAAVPFTKAFKDLDLECLPNRDSILYEDVYGIKGVSTLFRGTLRYNGFSSLMHVFRQMGLFGPELFDSTSNWEEVLDELRRIRGSASIDEFLVESAGGDRDLAHRATACLDWLHMTGRDDSVDQTAPIVDMFCQKLEEHLQFGEKENDMVVMNHLITGSFPNGNVEEHTSSLQAFGNESMTAMCKTVGYTTAASADLILRGGLVGRHGLLLPTTKDIYDPVLDSVAKEGIVFNERVRVGMGPAIDGLEEA